MSEHNFSHYFIVKQVKTAKDLITVLTESGVNENNIGIVSNDEEIVLADLPEADLTEKSAIPESLKRGALLGSGSALLAGVLVSAFPIAGLTVGGAAIAAMTAGGAALGAWSATMIGISENSPLVKQFQDSLDQEKTLIFCELSSDEEQKVKSELKQFDSSEYHFGTLEED